MKRTKFPQGWDEERTRHVLEHSDLNLDEDLEQAGIEAFKTSKDE